MRPVLLLAMLAASSLAAPVADTASAPDAAAPNAAAPNAAAPNAILPSSSSPSSGLASVDLGLTVFDQNMVYKADQSKTYIVFAYDAASCGEGAEGEKCRKLEQSLGYVMSNMVAKDAAFGKYKEHLVFGKGNKDDFPDHKKDFEKAKVPLPAILFWPAGHTRPSCKFDNPSSTPEQLSEWLAAKLRDEDDDDLLQFDEGSAPAAQLDDVSLLVCQADGGPNVVSQEEPSCSDLVSGADQGLVQVEKTQKVWDFKNAEQRFVGPADNSLPHTVVGGEPVVKDVDSYLFSQVSKQGKYQALYFSAPWCHYCECLGPVWDGVSANLVGSQRQPNLVVGRVDGDTSPELRRLLNVTAYPTFLLINKEGSTVLGRYLGPRKQFELSNWIEDLIVADENPVVKKQFDMAEQGEHTDMNPVYPYSGNEAFPSDSKLASQVLIQAGLSGNDFDECVDSDEAKFTAPGAALLVHYDSPRSLEFDEEVVNTARVPDKLTVIDFYAPWCPHCQKLNPVWDAVTEHKSGDKVAIGKVNVDSHPNIKSQFGIHRFPTIMYFKAGEPMAFDEARRYKGQRDVQSLEQWVASLTQ